MYATKTEKSRVAGAQLYELLGRLCEAIEPTDTQHETAKSRYAAVGSWLAASQNALIAGIEQTVRKLPEFRVKWCEERAVREFGPFGPR
jgi:hypothetical protein